MNKVNCESRVIYVCPVTEEETLEKILKSSPDINEKNLKVITGESNATIAFNKAIESLKKQADIVILLHQDVYLPSGWEDKFRSYIKAIETSHESWGAIGVAGANMEGDLSCSLWCSSINRELRQRKNEIEMVQSLDELLIAINLKSFKPFDEMHPGFHLFGTSIVQDFVSRGIPSFSINVPLIHHDKKKFKLGKSYFQAYNYIRNRFKDRLPIYTTIKPISKFGISLKYRELKFRLRRHDTANYELIDPIALSKSLGYEKRD